MEIKPSEIKLPLIVDSAMVIALLTLAYWTGTMSNKLDGVQSDQAEIHAQLNSPSRGQNAAKIAAIEATQIAQQAQYNELREFLDHRLTRIEDKVDRLEGR